MKFGKIRAIFKELIAIPRAIITHHDHCYDSYYGDFGDFKARLMVGNMAEREERESGYKVGPQFLFDICLGDHIGDFDSDHQWPRPEVNRHYLTRGISVIIWRYGFSFHWRGREITNTPWIPKYQLKEGWE